ncbi:prolyl oligopeptidase family serine peptidase [soil metagenome]
MRTILVMLAMTFPLAAQMPPTQNFAPPQPFTPDEATLKAIKEKTDELAKLIASQNRSNTWDVAIYLKAAQWIVRHNEWYSKDSGKQTLAVLDAGITRAKAQDTPWEDLRGKPIIKAYRSAIDDSLQPYSVTYPLGFGEDGKKYLVEINLHGRDATLTEVKFIASREAAKPSKSDRVQVDVYGRGNVGYRWAGEEDVLEVTMRVADGLSYPPRKPTGLDLREPILRGFSMGGGGTWHLGLHHPFRYCEMQPGAGFTLTRGHAAKFPDQLPDYQERCLRIYDVANCAENLANIPCVAYSGEQDPQIRAARNIEAALKDYKGPLKFEHVVAPGLEHKMPAEWKAKVDAKLAEFLPKDAAPPSTVHYVTYTTAYPDFSHGSIEGLEKHYERAVVDSVSTTDSMTVKTQNVASLWLRTDKGMPRPGAAPRTYKTVTIDGTTLDGSHMGYVKENGQWRPRTAKDQDPTAPLRKQPRLQGPIDDAFNRSFQIVPATKTAWNDGVHQAAESRRKNFVHAWDKYLRGDLTAKPVPESLYPSGTNYVFFGDPGSNPLLASVLPQLPLKWTKDELVMNGKTYDAKTHFPVMIYPQKHAVPISDPCYHVINSGHTFGEDAFKGTNVLLYPRLGDWAVMKLTPTKTDPHAVEVVDAGIFDENWQFERKK